MGFTLPLVHVENVAAAITLSLAKDEAVGQVFNVVDPEVLSKRAYMNAVIRRANSRARVVYLPFAILYALTWAQEFVFRLMGRRPFLTRYRLISSQKKIRYSSEKLGRRLGWTPPVSMREGLERLVFGRRIDTVRDTTRSAPREGAAIGLASQEP